MHSKRWALNQLTTVKRNLIVFHCNCISLWLPSVTFFWDFVYLLCSSKCKSSFGLQTWRLPLKQAFFELVVLYVSAQVTLLLGLGCFLFLFHETSTNVLVSFSTFSPLDFYSNVKQLCSDKEDLCFAFQTSSNKPAFHPFRKFHKSVLGILWAGIPQVLREHHMRIFPGILGPVQPQRQLI